MKNKIVLLLGLSGLALVSAFTFKLSNASFENNAQQTGANLEKQYIDLASSFPKETNNKNTLIASYSNQKLVINNTIKESVTKPNILFFI